MGSAGLPYGLQAMLKDGHKHLAGLDEAVYRNIEACKQFAQIIRTSMGPRGMNKMVINHLDKLFVTNDTATIINELEVEHPAAKLLVLAAKAQEVEVGDCANFVVSFGGALLAQAEGLLRDGLHTTEVATGYANAGTMALDFLMLQTLPDSDMLNLRDATAVAKRLKGPVGSKQYGCEDVLCPLIAQACILVCPKNHQNFNVDNVRVVKIPGAGVADSRVVKGMVIKRSPEGVISDVQDAKVAVFAQGIDAASTETKGTVLIHNASELENYAKQEEEMIERMVKEVADSGAKVVVAGSSIGEMAMHFIEKFGLMAVRIPSKFDLRRFCRAVGATALAKLGAPTPEELGFAKSLRVEEIGGTHVIVLEQDAAQGAVATVVLRSATNQVLDDLERAVDDGVNAFKVMCKDARAVAAGGAVEMEIARHLCEHARTLTGLEQYSYNKFAEALEVVPRTIADNSGLNATEAVAKLRAAHAEGQARAGLDIETGEARDLGEADIVDLYAAKWWALKLAVDAVTTILRVDQIIMAKPAGGPKPRAGDVDGDDD